MASYLYGGDIERDGVDGDETSGAEIPSLRGKLPDCGMLTFLKLLKIHIKINLVNKILQSIAISLLFN